MNLLAQGYAIDKLHRDEVGVINFTNFGENTHDEWDNKLVASLERELGSDYEIHYPRMPNEDDPKYALWNSAIKKVFSKFNDSAILVGRSLGGTILINVLAEEPPDWAPSGIFLIAAPFVGCWPSEDIEPIRISAPIRSLR